MSVTQIVNMCMLQLSFVYVCHTNG